MNRGGGGGDIQLRPPPTPLSARTAKQPISTGLIDSIDTKVKNSHPCLPVSGSHVLLCFVWDKMSAKNE